MEISRLMKEIVLATTNPGKIIEFKAFSFPDIEYLPLSLFHIEMPEETGQSFIENALLKARHVSQASQKPAVADDSGLVVPILGGEPGIRSARYAHEKANDKENIDCLLKRLKNLNEGQTNQDAETLHAAYFYTALVFVSHANDPVPLIAIGELQGQIAPRPIGDQGFGYDPIFYLPSYQCTLAQLSLTQKNQLSHRAKALIKMRQLFMEHYVP